MDVFKTFSFFFSLLGFFSLDVFEVSSFSFAWPTTNVASSFHAFLVFISEIFSYMSYILCLKSTEESTCVCLLMAVGHEPGLPVRQRKPKRKKTFVCQLSLTERLFYPMGHHPSRKVATFQLPNCAVQLLSLSVHKNLEKHEM